MKDNNGTFVRASLLLLVVIILSATIIGGMQCKSCQNTVSHLRSEITGLDRRVTLYANDGSIIREWTGNFNVEDKGGTVRFIDNNGNAIIIGGTFLIEENPKPRPPQKEEGK